MLAFLETGPAVRVPEEEYGRLLGCPRGYVLDGRAAGLARRTEVWYAAHGRPWIYARQAGGVDISGGIVRVGGGEFSPARLRSRLAAAGALDVAAVAVSAGRELEEKARALWEEGKPDEYFFLETYGSAVVEQLLAMASFRLCEWAEGAGLAILPHDSPGYEGWDIGEQARLLEYLRRDPALRLHGAIEALPSGMLKPEKSLLALFGIAEKGAGDAALPGPVPCDDCAMRGCAYRRRGVANMPPRAPARDAGRNAGWNAAAHPAAGGSPVPGGPQSGQPS